VSLYEDEVELYDIAFDWDVTDEVEWLLGRLGPDCAPVLEPGCGTGRMLEAFARRGVEVVGLDVSPGMVEFARQRLEDAGATAKVVVADMTAFDLRRTFGGAVCPIGTLTHLDREELARHLDCIARHLRPGARYLVQVGLVGENEAVAGSQWEAQRGDVRLKIAWQGVNRDLARGREVQRSRIEILSGPRKGEVVEELHEMTTWTPESWRDVIGASPFEQVAAYDGDMRERPRVELERGGGLLWHELVRE
jgi:SAM-dependent methyltransferase